MFSIRPAQSTDLIPLCALDSYALEHPERRDAIAAWIEARACRVAEVAGDIAGYGVLTNAFFDQPFIEIVMVSDRWRGRGVGRALVAHFQATCTGAKLFTSTNASNIPMQRLLLKSGFKASGRIDNLDENDPELVFFYPVPRTQVG